MNSPKNSLLPYNSNFSISTCPSSKPHIPSNSEKNSYENYYCEYPVLHIDFNYYDQNSDLEIIKPDFYYENPDIPLESYIPDNFALIKIQEIIKNVMENLFEEPNFKEKSEQELVTFRNKNPQKINENTNCRNNANFENSIENLEECSQSCLSNSNSESATVKLPPPMEPPAIKPKEKNRRIDQIRQKHRNLNNLSKNDTSEPNLSEIKIDSKPLPEPIKKPQIIKNENIIKPIETLIKNKGNLKCEIIANVCEISCFAPQISLNNKEIMNSKIYKPRIKIIRNLHTKNTSCNSEHTNKDTNSQIENKTNPITLESPISNKVSENSVQTQKEEICQRETLDSRENNIIPDEKRIVFNSIVAETQPDTAGSTVKVCENKRTFPSILETITGNSEDFQGDWPGNGPRHAHQNIIAQKIHNDIKQNMQEYEENYNQINENDSDIHDLTLQEYIRRDSEKNSVISRPPAISAASKYYKNYVNGNVNIRNSRVNEKIPLNSSKRTSTSSSNRRKIIPCQKLRHASNQYEDPEYSEFNQPEPEIIGNLRSRKLSPYAAPVVANKKSRRKRITAISFDKNREENTEIMPIPIKELENEQNIGKYAVGVGNYHMQLQKKYVDAVKRAKSGNKKPNRSTVVFNNSSIIQGNSKQKIDRNVTTSSSSNSENISTPHYFMKPKPSFEIDWGNSVLYKKIINGEIETLNNLALGSQKDILSESDLQSLLRFPGKMAESRKILRNKIENTFYILCTELGIPCIFPENDVFLRKLKTEIFIGYWK